MTRIRKRFAPDLGAARAVIAELSEQVDQILPAEEVSYLKLILCELLANAVEHGRVGTCRDEIVVRISIVPEVGVVVAVGDCSGQPGEIADPEEVLLCEHGRGLFILSAICETLAFRQSTRLMVARRRFGT